MNRRCAWCRSGCICPLPRGQPHACPAFPFSAPPLRLAERANAMPLCAHPRVSACLCVAGVIYWIYDKAYFHQRHDGRGKDRRVPSSAKQTARKRFFGRRRRLEHATLHRKRGDEGNGACQHRGGVGKFSRERAVRQRALLLGDARAGNRRRYSFAPENALRFPLFYPDVRKSRA